jgi:hypothetical protein
MVLGFEAGNSAEMSAYGYILKIRHLVGLSGRGTIVNLRYKIVIPQPVALGQLFRANSTVQSKNFAPTYQMLINV